MLINLNLPSSKCLPLFVIYINKILLNIHHRKYIPITNIVFTTKPRTTIICYEWYFRRQRQHASKMLIVMERIYMYENFLIINYNCISSFAKSTKVLWILM